MNVFILESRGESELMCLSGKIERGTDRVGESEREKSARISSLAICINQPLFDACGRQPSANRRTEVKLKKKEKSRVFFSSREIFHEKLIITIITIEETDAQHICSEQPLRGSSEEGTTIPTTQPRLGDLY